MARLRLGVLISGGGTNLQAIIDAIAGGELAADIQLVLSNKASAGGLARAEQAGLPTCVLSHRDYESREAFDAAVVDKLRQANVELVVLAGFMRIVTAVLLDAFPRRVINIHPSLLPAFPGVDAQSQALAYGVRVTGCTVHFVDGGVDTGPIIGQRSVLVHDDDTIDLLRDRILIQEHELLVEVLKQLAAGRVRIDESERVAGQPARTWVRVEP